MLEKSDKLIVLFSFMLFSLFAYKFTQFDGSIVGHSTEDLIAEVLTIEQIAKRKINGSLSWSNLSSNSSIYNGDQVFTDSKSQVEIKFKDSSSIVIPENTLIKIEKNIEGINLDLKEGLVDLDLSKFKNKKVRVQLGDRKIQLSGSDKAIVKIERVDNEISLTTNGENVLASEIPFQGEVPSKSPLKKIEIKKNEQILIKTKKQSKWQGELAQVGKRVDSRLLQSQFKKIEKILGFELKNSKKIVNTYRIDSKDLLKRSLAVDMTPKSVALNELRILKKSSSNKKDLLKIEKSIKRIKTVRNIAPLKSSVENFIKVKFPESKVLQSIANEEVMLAKKKKKYKSNEELLSSIGKKFDDLNVKRTPKRVPISFNEKLSNIGKSVNKTVAYTQLRDIQDSTSSLKIIEPSLKAFEKVYKNEDNLSPLKVASSVSSKFRKKLSSFENKKVVNKEVLSEITPVLQKEYSQENVKKITTYLSSYKFSSDKLKVDKELKTIFQNQLSSIIRKNSKDWSSLLSSTAEKVDLEISKEKSISKVNHKILLKNISSSLLLSKTDPSYKIIEKELSKSKFNKKTNAKIELDKLSKKLELKKVATPVKYKRNSWTKKLSEFSKSYEEALINSQKEEIVSQLPELKSKFIKKTSLITKSPKKELRELITKGPKSVVNIGPAKLEKVLINTQDINVDKQDLFEKISEKLSLSKNDNASKIFQEELRNAEFKNDDFSVESTLVKIGKVLDSKNIKSTEPAKLQDETFLGATAFRKSALIAKALPKKVEAGVDVKLITSKTLSSSSSYEVEFSKDKDFKEITYKKKISNKSEKLNFSKKGKYYYRVTKSLDNKEATSFDISHAKPKKEKSAVESIEIVPAKPPQVLVTKTGVIDNKTFSSYPLKWSGKKNSQYEVEITQKDPITKKTKVLKKVVVKKNQVKINLSKANLNLSLENKELSAKGVTYRVRKAGRVKSDWSEPVETSVSIPMVILPVQDNSVLVKKRFKKKTVVPFKWKSSFKNEKHVLTVAKDKEFKNLIVKKEVIGETANVTTSHEGPIFWKVIPKKLSSTPANSVAPVMKKSILSSTIRIDKKIVKSTVEKSIKAPETKVKIGWRYTRPTNTKLKEVELSTDPNFKNIIATKSIPTSKKKTEFKVKNVGQYFWRVKDKGKKAKNISGVNSFSVVENIELPVPVIKEKQIISYKIVNELPAYEIILPQVQGASLVELEVYSDEQLQKLVFKKRFTRKKALWVTNRAGKFYYRARSISKTGRKSKYSKVGKLIFPISPLIRSDLE
jgi:hypothetical protein